MHSFAGTTALITGSSKGIGQAYAHQLASRGADLVLVARSAEALEMLAAQLRETHQTRVVVLPVDLFDRAAPQAIANTLAEHGIEIDLLINNAGMGAVGPFLPRPLTPNVDSVDLNITALIGLVHSIGAGMLERGRGGIINVASVAAFQPMPFQASYGATKAFVLSFTEAIAEELRGTDIRVMAVHPGPVETSFFDTTTATLNPKAVSPERIAAKSLDDFAHGRAISFPGGRSDRAIAFISRLISRNRMARLSGNVNRRAGHDHVRDIASPTTG
ncbi:MULTISPECIES: SDR family NAD(P)-dependent oxidoreductase [Pseudonocardia]|nr:MULTISPECIES: SDR family oxidoreductase [Pseudonocardia]BBG00921.1 dehydrogenase [Pseudonocardia autotrophica]GEC27520.1 dehydrogenase [Pseudonocardia saturnea]